MPETDIFRVRPSFVPFFFIILGIGLLTGLVAFMLFSIEPLVALAAGLVGIFAAIIVFLAWFTTEYALTTEKVHIRRGILTIFHEDIESSRVSSVELHQKILGRILNYGDVVIHGDSPNSIITFHQIGNPKFRHEQIEEETVG